MTTLVFKFVSMALALLSLAAPIRAQSPASLPAITKPTLVQALVCEQVEGLAPKKAAVVFPLSLGEVACFTAFDPVPAETVIYHHWFIRDQPSARIRLRIKPPRWSSFSRVQLRPGDVGPWRVEVIDADGKRLALLRFSVIE